MDGVLILRHVEFLRFILLMNKCCEPVNCI